MFGGIGRCGSEIWFGWCAGGRVLVWVVDGCRADVGCVGKGRVLGKEKERGRRGFYTFGH